MSERGGRGGVVECASRKPFEGVLQHAVPVLLRREVAVGIKGRVYVGGEDGITLAVHHPPLLAGAGEVDDGASRLWRGGQLASVPQSLWAAVAQGPVGDQC